MSSHLRVFACVIIFLVTHALPIFWEEHGDGYYSQLFGDKEKSDGRKFKIELIGKGLYGLSIMGKVICLNEAFGRGSDPGEELANNIAKAFGFAGTGLLYAWGIVSLDLFLMTCYAIGTCSFLRLLNIL
ncbi:DEAD-box ATP-dependent RNA helicase [Corchorus olitorius]|uniref:DEAD-box ATP-dependent RNA helicase n=1 Tax=Corchorus olitorius TaxID=93759 RepID=A0A1R3GJR6_9ROSI|nr:DEAD-box ATP-dependent RNA helicase [Corchorus olitorius]